MKKLLLRIGAFALDTIFVIIISTMFCMIPFINPNLKEISTNQDALDHEVELAKDLKDRTKNYIKDNKINKFEYKEILDDFPTYYELFKDVVIDAELTDDFKDNIQNRIDEHYVTMANDYSYTISKLSLNTTIITIIIYMLYFGILPFFTKGQTLAKKILHLKVVDSVDEEKDIPLWKYLVKAFLICEIVFTIINLIIINTMSKNAFINISYWLNQARYFYEIAFLICLVLREDQRSIHDLLLGTTVILIDKKGNKIPDSNYALKEQSKIEELTEEKANSKKPTTSKKTTMTKKTTNKKEEVVAEKVND